MRGPRSPRRARVGAVLSALGCALALFAVAAPKWFTTEVPGVVDRLVEVSVTGTGAVPALGGVALVLLAAGGALGIVGPVGRRVVGGLWVVAGAVAAWSTLEAIGSPAAALRGPAAAATGVGAVGGEVSVAPWPYAALVLAVVVLALGLWHLAGLGPWPMPGSRHARAGAGATPTVSDDEADPTRDWDALSEGDDPTSPGRIP